jgi:hypothetical protein
LALVGLAAAGLLLATAVAGASRSVGGLLIIRGYSLSGWRVTIVSLEGKRLPVPARVREAPYGLSPDARYVAEIRAASVLVGRVRGGAMRMLLRNPCGRQCRFEPSFAWSPDSRELAVAATLRGSSLLRVFDRNARAVRSFTLPRTNPEHGGQASYEVVAWSPDRSRLLLRRRDEYAPTAVVALTVKTGELRTLVRVDACDNPAPTWSPNGRFVALVNHPTHVCGDRFAVIDVTNGRRIIDRSWARGYGRGWTLWAADSRSMFGAVAGGTIARFYLTGRRISVVTSSPGWSATPHIALATGLVYTATPPNGRPALYLYHFATGRRELLLAPSSVAWDFLPLQRLP